MAGGLSYYQADLILDALFGSGTPATFYVGLLITALPSEGGVGITEPSTGGYARTAMTNNATNFPAAASGVQTTGTDIGWSAFSTDMPEFLGAGIWDAASAGNLVAWAEFSTPRTVLDTETFSIPSGQTIVAV